MPEKPIPKLHSSVLPRRSIAQERSLVASIPYAELDVVSNFSFLRGASHPDELVNRAGELGYTAVGITDVNSLAGIVRAHQAAKHAGIKLCIGARLRFTDAPDVLVWVENRVGYASLCRLLTDRQTSSREGFVHPSIGIILLASSDGLLAVVTYWSIDPEMPVSDGEAFQAAARIMKDAIGDRLSLAVSRLHDGSDQRIPIIKCNRSAACMEFQFWPPIWAALP